MVSTTQHLAQLLSATKRLLPGFPSALIPVVGARRTRELGSRRRNDGDRGESILTDATNKKIWCCRTSQLFPVFVPCYLYTSFTIWAIATTSCAMPRKERHTVSLRCALRALDTPWRGDRLIPGWVVTMHVNNHAHPLLDSLQTPTERDYICFVHLFS